MALPAAVTVALADNPRESCSRVILDDRHQNTCPVERRPVIVELQHSQTIPNDARRRDPGTARHERGAVVRSGCDTEKGCGSAVPVRVELDVRAVSVGSPRERSVWGLLALLLVVMTSSALLAGCGGAGSAQGPSGRAALLTTLENWSALETPVDQALGILTQQCMAQRGLRYYPFPQAGQPGGPPLFATGAFGSSLWLGPQSLAWRIVNGWGLYEQTMQQLSQPGGLAGGPPLEIRVMQSMGGRAMQTYMRALWGGGKTMKIRIPGLPRATVQIGGCNTTAGTQLFGSVAASVAVPQYGPAILTGSIQPSAARSPALRASEADWAACVRAGTRVVATSPSRLFLHFYSLYQTKGPTPAVHRKEVAAAVTDLKCQRRSRLPQMVRHAALTAIGHLPASVLGELETLLAVLEHARVRARAVFAHPATNPSPVRSPAGANGPAGAAGSQALSGAGSSSRSVVVFGG